MGSSCSSKKSTAVTVPAKNQPVSSQHLENDETINTASEKPAEIHPNAHESSNAPDTKLSDSNKIEDVGTNEVEDDNPSTTVDEKKEESIQQHVDNNTDTREANEAAESGTTKQEQLQEGLNDARRDPDGAPMESKTEEGEGGELPLGKESPSHKVTDGDDAVVPEEAVGGETSISEQNGSIAVGDVQNDDTGPVETEEVTNTTERVDEHPGQETVAQQEEQGVDEALAIPPSEEAVNADTTNTTAEDGDEIRDTTGDSP